MRRISGILRHRRCLLHPPGLAGPQYPRSSDLMGSVKRRRSSLNTWRFTWLSLAAPRTWNILSLTPTARFPIWRQFFNHRRDGRDPWCAGARHRGGHASQALLGHGVVLAAACPADASLSCRHGQVLFRTDYPYLRRDLAVACRHDIETSGSKREW